MLIKEATKMRRVLYLFLIVVMLAVPASTVFAEPTQELPGGDWYLGELVPIAVGGFTPGERVDAWLYRPSTIAGWPLATQPPVMGPTGNMWWWEGPASQQRRWSFSETGGTPLEVADAFGIWGAILMLPRDEVWYPCSFPLKWKCNYELAPGVYELHSPQTVNYIGFPPEFAYLEYWPWIDIFGAAADPMDTISPLEIDVFNYIPPIIGPQFEVVITGYDWKWTDIDW
jgi:hypothetical protein